MERSLRATESRKMVLLIPLFVFLVSISVVYGDDGTASPSLAKPISPGFFGLHVNHNSVPWPTVPFGSYRTLGSSIKWADINVADQKYAWSRLDQWLEKAEAGSQDVLFTLYATPHWASSNPNDKSCAFQSQNGSGICDPPDDLNNDGTGTNQHFKDFVTALINHVGSRKIKYWEIWNEPNIRSEWNGTMAQLIRMAEDARSIILSVDPEALFTTPAPANVKGQAKWMKRYLAAGGGQYADIVAFHGYVGGTCPDACPVAEDVGKLIDNLRAVLKEYGLQNKPLFDTEGSWGAQSNMTDPDLQAAFTARYYLTQISKGIDKFYWYGWDFQNTGHFYDMTTNELNSSGIAYEQVHDWTVGATFSTPCSADAKNVWTCRLTRPGGYEAFVVWDSSGEFVVYPGAPYCQYLDIAGNRTPYSGGPVDIGIKPLLFENVCD